LGIAGGLAGCGDVATSRNPANCSNRDHFDLVHAGRKEDQRSPLHHLHLLLYSKKNASGAELVFQRCHSVNFLDRAATAYEETYLKGSRVNVSSFGYKELVQKHRLTEYILMVENSGVSISFSRLLSHNMPHPYFSPPKIAYLNGGIHNLPFSRASSKHVAGSISSGVCFDSHLGLQRYHI